MQSAEMLVRVSAAASQVSVGFDPQGGRTQAFLTVANGLDSVSCPSNFPKQKIPSSVGPTLSPNFLVSVRYPSPAAVTT